MKKKLVAMLMCAAMVGATMLTGCGGSSDEGGSDSSKDSGSETSSDSGSSDKKYDGVELTFWSMWTNTEPQGKVLQEAVDAFSDETGAEVTIEWKGRDIKNIVSSALEAEEKSTCLRMTITESDITMWTMLQTLQRWQKQQDMQTRASQYLMTRQKSGQASFPVLQSSLR